MSDNYFDRVEAELERLTTDGAHLRARPALMRRFRIPTWVPATVGLSLSAAIVAMVAVLTFGTHHRSAAPPTALSGGGGTTAPALLANFQLLRRPAQPGDRSAVGLSLGTCTITRTPKPHRQSNPLMPQQRPPAVCGAGPTGLQRRYGLEDPPSLLLRGASIPTTSIKTWLIAGSRGACWDAVGPRPDHVIGERCFTTADLDQRILVGTIPRPARSGSEVGLVTDKALGLALRKPDGTTTPLPLAEGYFFTAYQPGDKILADTSAGIRPIQSFGSP